MSLWQFYNMVTWYISHHASSLNHRVELERRLNKAATDVWGKQFFTMVAHSAGILWPIPFCLGWMDLRFADVDFLVALPISLIFEHGVGYSFIFIPTYILCRILFKYMRPYLPYFRSVQKMLDEAGGQVSAQRTATHPLIPSR